MKPLPLVTSRDVAEERDTGPMRARVELGLPRSHVARWAVVKTADVDRFELDQKCGDPSGHARLIRVYVAIAALHRATLENSR